MVPRTSVRLSIYEKELPTPGVNSLLARVVSPAMATEYGRLVSALIGGEYGAAIEAEL